MFGASPDAAWSAAGDAIGECFDAYPAGLMKAVECVDTSFYTPPASIDLMFEVLRAAGSTGGSVLEAGCGSGRLRRQPPRRCRCNGPVSNRHRRDGVARMLNSPRTLIGHTVGAIPGAPVTS